MIVGNFEDYLDVLLPEATATALIKWVCDFVDQWGRRPTARELRAFLLRPS
jgi:hypothetical protein